MGRNKDTGTALSRRDGIREPVLPFRTFALETNVSESNSSIDIIVSDFPQTLDLILENTDLICLRQTKMQNQVCILLTVYNFKEKDFTAYIGTASVC